MVKRFLVVAVSAMALSCGGSGTDVVVEQKATIEVSGVFNGTVSQTQYFQESKQAVQTTVVMSSPSADDANPMTQENESIIRLDKGVMWLMPGGEDSMYVEMPLGMIRDNFERMRQQFAALDTSAGASPGLKIFDNSHWEMTVNDSLEEKTINGFPCQKMEMHITGSSDQLPTDSVFLRAEIWYSGDFPQADFVLKETQAVVDALGVDPNWLVNILLSFVGQLGHAFTDLSDALNELDGVPIQTSLVMEASTATDPSAQTSDSLAKQDMVSVVVALARMYAQATGVPAPTGHFRMLSLSSEVTSIRHEAIDAARFEVPAGMVRQDMPGVPGSSMP